MAALKLKEDEPSRNAENSIWERLGHVGPEGLKPSCEPERLLIAMASNLSLFTQCKNQASLCAQRSQGVWQQSLVAHALVSLMGRVIAPWLGQTC